MTSVIFVNRCFVIYKGKIIIIKRADNDRNNPGQWEIPGGKLDMEIDSLQSLSREIMEEIGLQIKDVDVEVFVESYFLNNGPYSGNNYIILFTVACAQGGEICLSAEHSEYKLVCYEEMLKHNLTKETKKAAIALKKVIVNFVKSSL